MQPWILKGPHFVAPDRHAPLNNAELAAARDDFLRERPGNLDFLLQKRYGWMNEFLSPEDTVVEFGAGLGFSREYINVGKLIVTDFDSQPWLDQTADALDPPFAANSLDAIIWSNVLHHLAQPTVALKKACEILKPGGKLLIQDAYPSLLLRTLMYLADNEGWSFESDVFDPSVPANDPNDPWSGNTAIPYLLFRSHTDFERALPEFEIIKHDLSECLLFPLSGGVIQRKPTVPLPRAMLRLIDCADGALITMLPNIFALACSVVLRKRDDKHSTSMKLP